MNMILKLICVWGIVDGVWLICSPDKWGKTWREILDKIAADRLLAGLSGGFEVAICLWLIKRLCCRK